MFTIRNVSLCFLVACGGGSHPAQNVTTTTNTPPPSADGGGAQVQLKTDKAHKLLVSATACWLGGIWAQAEGEWTVAAKRTGDETRCKDVLFQATMKDEDLAPLRALDPKIVGPLSDKIEAFAKEDGFDADRAKNVRKLFDAIAAAQREALVVRRAADRIKLDFEKLKSDKEREAARDKESDKLTADEVTLAKDMKVTSAMEALYGLDAGPYTNDAKALGLVTAMERVKAARGLPGHLKVFVAAGAYKMVFGVEPPVKLSDDPKGVPIGTWLKLEKATAAAAGHAVPATAKTPKEINQLAWSGVVQGFGDKLTATQAALGDSPFKDFVANVTKLVQIRADVTQQLAPK